MVMGGGVGGMLRRWSWLAIAVLIAVLFCNAEVVLAGVPPHRLHGVAPDVVSFYTASSTTFRCRDGSKSIPADQVNDDFCDCNDGSDEPGTSACPNGKFYCANRGYTPKVLNASFVNDGICDCCDASDEYDARGHCTNTCQQFGQSYRDELKAKVASYEQGVHTREKWAAEAREKREKWADELAKLTPQVKQQSKLVNQLKERKEKAEQVEREEREREERERKLQEESQPPTEEPMQSEPASEETSDASSLKEAVEPQELPIEDSPESYEDHTVPHPPAEEEPAKPMTADEIGRMVASRWTGELGKQEEGQHQDERNPYHEDDDLDPPYEPEPEPDHEPDQPDLHDQDDDEPEWGDDIMSPWYAKDDEDEEGQQDDNDFDDEHGLDDNHDEYTDHEEDTFGEGVGEPVEPERTPTVVNKVRETMGKLTSSLLTGLKSIISKPEEPMSLSEAEQVKKEYEREEAALRKLEDSKKKLQAELAYDGGPDNVFLAFVNQCFEYTTHEYRYDVCPFKDASQNNVAGGSKTRLGKWEGWRDNHSAMLFGNGEHCWNGPNRSLKVALECGPSNQLSSVEEPNRCEYTAVLATPAACDTAQLQRYRKEHEDAVRALFEPHQEL
eukprot:jgi/Chlat1/4821/Chrsp31S04866